MTEWPFCCGVRMVLTYDDIDEPELETYFECIYCDKKQLIGERFTVVKKKINCLFQGNLHIFGQQRT